MESVTALPGHGEEAGGGGCRHTDGREASGNGVWGGQGQYVEGEVEIQPWEYQHFRKGGIEGGDFSSEETEDNCSDRRERTECFLKSKKFNFQGRSASVPQHMFSFLLQLQLNF